MFVFAERNRGVGVAKITALKYGFAVSLLFMFQECFGTDNLPREALETEITRCKYIAMVEGDSGQARLKNWQQIAKSAALKQAAKMYVSDVVWDKVIALRPNSGIVLGKAYRCNKP